MSLPLKLPLTNCLLKLWRSILHNPFSVGVWVCAILSAMPLFAIMFMALSTSSGDVWTHLLDTVLWGYIYRSLILMAGVALGTTLIGVAAAWLVVHCRFPGRKLFQVLLILPMAIPAYIMAFVFTDQLEYAGTIQRYLRWLFGWQSKADYYFPQIRSLGGAIICMVLVLYPYVYLMACAGFHNVTRNSWESARLMGHTSMTIFWRVAVPIARPNIIVGMALVMMETLSDFGTVSYFAVNTLARGVYDVWLDMDSLVGASQISVIMMLFVGFLLYLEKQSRVTGRAYENKGSPMSPLILRGKAKGLAIAFCTVVCGLGFVIPAGILTTYAITYFDDSWGPKFIGYMTNSLTLAGLTALITLVVALIMAYGVRLNANRNGVNGLVLMASAGYGIPGTVLGVGVLVLLSRVDNNIDAVFESLWGINTGLLLTGSMVGLAYAYSVRFMTLGYGGVSNVLQQVSTTLEGSARTLGHSPLQIFWKVHLPLIRNGIMLSVVLVFVDAMKELSITMVLKPLNFDTLSTHVFAYAKDGFLEYSALGAITIVAVGLIPVVYLMQMVQPKKTDL